MDTPDGKRLAKLIGNEVKESGDGHENESKALICLCDGYRTKGSESAPLLHFQAPLQIYPAGFDNDHLDEMTVQTNWKG